MARRKSTKMSRMRNIEPAQLTLTFANFTVGGPVGPGLPGPSITKFIDLSQVNSLLSRRFYRQGLNYGVAGIRILTGSGYNGIVTVSKLPNTWVMANAWKKSMAVWTRMNNEALSESGTIRPRFLDFKVYADKDHHNAGYGANLLPLSLGNGTPPSLPTANVGEWEPSKIVIPSQVALTSTSFEVIATGTNAPGVGASGLDALSLIEGYAASRLLPNVLDPNAPADAGDPAENWMTSVFSDGTQQDDDVIDDMISENNIAPYPFENDGVNPDTMYPGGANQLTGLELHAFELVSATTIGGQTRVKGGNFPCGLIRLDLTNGSGAEAPIIVVVDLIPGSHRGLLAEPMQEM